MGKRKLLLALGLGAVLTSGASYGETVRTATLTTSQEAGTVTLTRTDGTPRPTPSGTATFTLNDAMTQLSMTATVFEIDVTGTQTADDRDNLAAAHIHGGPNNAQGTTNGVVWGFFGTPDNDNNPDQLVVTPFASGVGGTFTSIWDAAEGNGTPPNQNTLATQLARYFEGQGRLYINFHTVQNGGGEVRGAIVPEPASLSLLSLGALGLLGRRRRR